MVDLTRAVWRKSSYSGTGNNCVEVAITRDRGAVRDSKDPEGSALALLYREWKAFVAAVCDGQFNV